jgi:hypothetical protein
MPEQTGHVDFWRGFVVGGLVGLVAAAYARGDFRRMLSFASDSEPELPSLTAGAERQPNPIAVSAELT